jgi:hypothetical protein
MRSSTDTNRKGALSEMTVEIDLVQRGFVVGRPFPITVYDLLVDDGSTVDAGGVKYALLKRVQTKTARIEARTIDPTMKVSLDPPFVKGDYDVLAIVRPETSETFYIASDELSDGQTSVTLKWREGAEGTYWVEKYRDWPMKAKGDE